MNEKLLQPLHKGVCMGIICQPPSHAPLMVPHASEMPCVTWNYSTAVTASCSGEKGQGGTSPLPLPHSGSCYWGQKSSFAQLTVPGTWRGPAGACADGPLGITFGTGRDSARCSPSGGAGWGSYYLCWAKMHWIDSRVSVKPVPGQLTSEAQPQGAGWDVLVLEL